MGMHIMMLIMPQLWYVSDIKGKPKKSVGLYD